MTFKNDPSITSTSKKNPHNVQLVQYLHFPDYFVKFPLPAPPPLFN